MRRAHGQYVLWVATHVYPVIFISLVSLSNWISNSLEKFGSDTYILYSPPRWFFWYKLMYKDNYVGIQGWEVYYVIYYGVQFWDSESLILFPQQQNWENGNWNFWVVRRLRKSSNLDFLFWRWEDRGPEVGNNWSWTVMDFQCKSHLSCDS